MDHLIYNNQCFFSFEEVEQMLDVLYKTGSPVRIYSCLPVERCNQLDRYSTIDTRWRYSFARFVCDNPGHFSGIGSCSFSFEIFYSRKLDALVLTGVDNSHRCKVPYEIFATHRKDQGDLTKPIVLRTIRSKAGHIMAVFRQSIQQQKLFKKYGDVLIVQFYSSTVSAQKTLLAISVVNESGAGLTVGFAILLGPISLKTISCCFQLFTQFNEPLNVGCVVVSQEELLPGVRKYFPKADHICSLDRMLQQVADSLSTYSVDLTTRKKLNKNFFICCTTTSEREFGSAESVLLSTGGEVGTYFENQWFQRTEIWQIIDKLIRKKTWINIAQITSSLNRILSQIQFFSDHNLP